MMWNYIVFKSLCRWNCDTYPIYKYLLKCMILLFKLMLCWVVQIYLFYFPNKEWPILGTKKIKCRYNIIELSWNIVVHSITNFWDSVQCTLYSVHCTLSIVHYTLNSVQGKRNSYKQLYMCVFLIKYIYN